MPQQKLLFNQVNSHGTTYFKEDKTKGVPLTTKALARKNSQKNVGNERGAVSRNNSSEYGRGEPGQADNY